jgi:hypothetical protein
MEGGSAPDKESRAKVQAAFWEGSNLSGARWLFYLVVDRLRMPMDNRDDGMNPIKPILPQLADFRFYAFQFRPRS